jgi:hypothetical protein
MTERRRLAAYSKGEDTSGQISATTSTTIRTKADALRWLAEQAGGRVEISKSALAREWGWARTTLRRLLKEWAKQGTITISAAADGRLAISIGQGNGHGGPAMGAGGSAATAAAPASAQEIEILPAPSAWAGGAITMATLIAALALTAVSGSFSIMGLTSIFVGSFWPILGMGAALEIGELSAVAWLGRHGRDTSRPLKVALIALVAFLMSLNAIGAYGYLVRAHIEHALANELQVAGQAAEIDAKIAVQTGVVADLDRRIGQIDAAIDIATQHGRINAAMAQAEQQRKIRADLAAAHLFQGKALAALQLEKVRVDGERRKVESDLGPVRYISALIGASDDEVMR